MPITNILWLPDLHAGSPVALYPDETLPLLSGPRGPSLLQQKLHDHYREVLEYTAIMREQADRLVVIIAGDLVEGLHHKSQEVVSAYLTDHQKIAESLIRECKEVTHYDTIYFLDGTPEHVGENEYNLSETLQGERYAPGRFTWPVLKKLVHGHLIYAAHHGPGPGKGWLRGNLLRGRIKTLDYELTKQHERIPEQVVYAHMHYPHYECINLGDYAINAYTLPSWKLLDGYMNKVDPFSFSRIGAMVTTVTPDKIENEFLCIHLEQNKIGEL